MNEIDEKWVPEEQAAFSAFLKNQFPNEMDSLAIRSLGSAWKDGQTFAAQLRTVEQSCRNDGRCEYAIQSGAEGNGHCPDGKCAMPQYTGTGTGTGSDTLDCILGVGGFASFGPLEPQPAAHLTVPGSLEWDGDNGTHSELNTHGEHGTHSVAREAVRDAIAASLGDSYDCTRVWSAWQVGTMDQDDFSLIADDEGRLQEIAEAAIQAYDSAEVNRLRAQLANTEQSRRSFFDLSQDLEKRLAYMVEAMNQIVQVSSMYEKPFEIATLAIGELSAMAEPCCAPTAEEEALLASGDYRPEELWGGPVPTCPKCIKSESSAPIAPGDDIPDFTPGSGNKAKRRAESLGIAYPPTAKPAPCIECDQPYCHGVCVERGDQDYDRDQAARGGADE